MKDTPDQRSDPRAVLYFAGDLIVVTLFSLAFCVIPVMFGFVDSRTITFLSVVFVFFVPGYALVAALFPRGGRVGMRRVSERTHPLNYRQRVGLAIGSSLLLAPAVGVSLSYLYNGGEVLTLLALGVLSILLAIAATVRRYLLPERERFELPYSVWRRYLNMVFRPHTRGEFALIAVLVVVALAVVSGVAYAMVLPDTGEGHTEFYLLSEDEDGDLAAGNYPTSLTEDDEQSLTVAVSNQENQATTYTVVVQIQSVATDDNETRIEDRNEIDRFSVAVDQSDTVHYEHTPTSETTGDDLRLTYLLYTDEVPDEPTDENAYRSTYIWVDSED